MSEELVPGMPQNSFTSRSAVDILSTTADIVGISKCPSSVELSGQCTLWPVDEKLYKLLHIIGQGATSKVYSAEFASKKCAIKIINLENCSTNDGLKEINREIASMKRLKHDNIVAYYVSFINETKLNIVMDLCERGSLLDKIKQTQLVRSVQQGVFDETAIATILKDVLRGLTYIHENDLVHRDLKCGNLLVRNDGCIQIADFGVTAFLNNSQFGSTDNGQDRGTRRTFVGTPCWMAPEVMNQVQGYNWKADIWSLGITTIELATGQAPYAKYAPFKVLMMTLTNDPPSIDTCASHSNQYENYGQKFRKFCKLCLVKDPQQRATTKDLLNHTFIKSKAKDHEFIVKTLYDRDNVDPPQKQEEEEPISSDNEQPVEADWNFPNEDNINAEVAKVAAATEESLNTLQAGMSGSLISSTQMGTISTNLTATSKSMQSSDQHSNTRSADATIYRITLMKRNQNSGNELQNISFAYVVGTDTAETLANDLVNNDLLGRTNFCIVAHNIKELISNPDLKEKCFPLNLETQNSSGSAQVANETEMIGFAKLSICLYDQERDKDLL